MRLTILTFGIAREITGNNSLLEVEIAESSTVGDLKNSLLLQFPRFEDLASLQIAVNAEFAPASLLLRASDEIALIPPVSGG